MWNDWCVHFYLQVGHVGDDFKLRSLFALWGSYQPPRTRVIPRPALPQPPRPRHAWRRSQWRQDATFQKHQKGDCFGGLHSSSHLLFAMFKPLSMFKHIIDYICTLKAWRRREWKTTHGKETVGPRKAHLGLASQTATRSWPRDEMENKEYILKSL